MRTLALDDWGLVDVCPVLPREKSSLSGIGGIRSADGIREAVARAQRSVRSGPAGAVGAVMG